MFPIKGDLYKGAIEWNPNTNTPKLTDEKDVEEGYIVVVSENGYCNLGSGTSAYQKGNYMWWDKIWKQVTIPILSLESVNREVQDLKERIASTEQKINYIKNHIGII